MTKIRAENQNIRKASSQLTQKLNLTRKSNEIKLVEVIKTGTTMESDSPHLVTCYSATLSEDDFELDVEKDLIKPRHDSFLKNVEEKCDLTDEAQRERYGQIRNQVLDRFKNLLTSSSNRSRSSSINSRGSISSRASNGIKRDWFDSDEELASKSGNTKPRIESPLV